ncbi:N-acetylmuramic acid 6-phosphate etherase [Alicyclobacillus acidiphilus]|uniref:N-acetylmuramic acid 6-phosphate etherase n=1 Tax=Alicyclobacillus acidiphilus TaxID=182455 RepID=UPI000B28EBFF
MEAIWGLQTEQSLPEYDRLDVSSTSEILSMMNEADQTVPIAVKKALPAVEEAVELIVKALSSGGRLFYIGAGTSGRLGVLDAAECPPTFGTPMSLVQGLIAGGQGAMFKAVEEAEDKWTSASEDLTAVGLCERDVVVGISASGRTPYVVGGLTYARSVGSATIALSCNTGASIGRLADVSIEIDTGPEVLAGSTRLKAGTAEKLVLNMLSTASMVRLGKAYRNLMVDLKVTNEKLQDRARRIVMTAAAVDYDAAERALRLADGHVKTAIVMARRAIDKAAAEAMLNRANGFLRVALEEDVFAEAGLVQHRPAAETAAESTAARNGGN